MFKSMMTICLFAMLALALASAKPHLLTTGISYATPAVAAPIAAAPFATVGGSGFIARPVLAASSYYPAYTSPYYGSYATYPY